MGALVQCDIGSDEDHIAAPPSHHVGHDRRGEPIGTQQVHLNLRGEGVGAHFMDPPRVHVAGTRHQQVDLAQCIDALRNKGLHRVRVGDVQREGDRLSAVGLDLLDEFGQLVDASGAERHRKSTARELDCRRRADT